MIRTRRSSVPLYGLAVLLILISFVAFGQGAVRIPAAQCLNILLNKIGIALGPVDAQQQAVLLNIRLPRVLLAILVGAGLGVSGAAMQGLLRNPLADPSLIGISSGGALAATAVFVLSDTLAVNLSRYPGMFALPAAAFAGGLITTIAVYRLSRVSGRMVIGVILLAGIAINAIAQAFSSLLSFYATDTQIRSITFWRLGSLGGATWLSVAVIAPFILIPVIGLTTQSRALNTFLLGESEAFHLGIRVERVKKLVIVLVAMAAGASVAVTGIIGFVGLVVPHMLRLISGPDYRRLLPGSALLGAIVLVGADLISRTLVVPAELPIGIITALGGAPFFLYLLLRDRKFRIIS